MPREALDSLLEQVQVAVDTKHKLIVEQQVTNQVVDMGLLTQTAKPAKLAH